MTGEIKPQVVPCSIIFASVVFCNGFICIYTLLLPGLKTRGHEDHTTRNAVPINSQLALLWPFQIALNADGVYNIWRTATSERVFYYIYGLSTSINHRHCLCARVELVSIASPDVISFHISLGEWVTGKEFMRTLADLDYVWKMTFDLGPSSTLSSHVTYKNYYEIIWNV